MRKPDIVELPVDHESEMATIGACLMTPPMRDYKMIEYAITTLKPFDFYGLSAQTAFIAIAKLMNNRLVKPDREIDLITMTSYLRHAGKLHECSVAFLASCIDICPSVQNIAAYVENVLQCSQRRRLMQLSELILDTNFEASQTIIKTRAALDAIETGKSTDLKELFKENK